jgi:phosphate transport system permease protein
MPLQIYDWAGRPNAEFRNLAAAGIIILLAVLLVFNAIAVWVRQKVQKPLS